VYFAILYGLAVAGKITDNTKSFMMLGLVVTIFAFSFFYMKRHRRPLREWGFTLKEWALALRLATLTVIPLAAAGILLKWVLTRQPGSAHYGAPLFAPVELVGLLYYIPIAAIQEITTRGILQTSIQRIVPGRHAFAMAIFLTALIFAITHVYYSTFTMLVTLVASLYFGWLFHRHRTLVGVAAAHYLLGYLYVFLLRLIAW